MNVWHQIYAKYQNTKIWVKNSIITETAYESMTWLKVFTNQTLCLDLNSLSVVEERCIREEAEAKAKVDLIQVRMLAWVARRSVRITPVETLRIPEQGSSPQGKSGPKPRPKGVGDGQQVDIPVPLPSLLSRVWRRRIVCASDWKC